jgi:hypothetical protein
VASVVFGNVEIRQQVLALSRERRHSLEAAVLLHNSMLAQHSLTVTALSSLNDSLFEGLKLKLGLELQPISNDSLLKSLFVFCRFLFLVLLKPIVFICSVKNLGKHVYCQCQA